jgi:hypothetical protein
MFTNENENFIRWMENLENHCQQFIFKNREKWFDGQLELHDIENYFTSPLKLYKSGKYYISRVNVNTVLNKPALKIYDENENEVEMDSINDKTNVVTIVEIQGIKCSSRSFQIEIDLKQMMVLQPTNLFEKCIIKPTNVGVVTADLVIEENKMVNYESSMTDATITMQNLNDDVTENIVLSQSNYNNTNNNQDNDNQDNDNDNQDNDNDGEIGDDYDEDENRETTIDLQPINDNKQLITEIIEVSPDGIEEIDFDLEELKQDDEVQIKKRNEVYYEMYREARRKAKTARDLALSAYLEVKRIKNTYMLHDMDDTDDSDLETDEDIMDRGENPIDQDE